MTFWVATNASDSSYFIYTLLNFDIFGEGYSFSMVMLDRFESGVMSPGHLLEDFLFCAFLCKQEVTEQLYNIMCTQKGR